MIIAAAVIIDGKIKALPAPARHHDVMHKFPLGKYAHGEQGFIDDELGFLDRSQAFWRAKDEGQIIRITDRAGELYSEDLW